MNFLTVQGCPVSDWLAPYIYIVTHDCAAVVNSIYRGDDAAAILHAHGRHTQRELYELGYPANPPGFSTHELRSDGVAYPAFPRGSKLLWWMQGFDVNDGDVGNVIYQAKRRGWKLFQPYPGGVEYHHLNFSQEPKPHSPATAFRIKRIRRALPRT